jgi:DNA-directed RNA polymerase specialized sigma24 family protein
MKQQPRKRSALGDEAGSAQFPVTQWSLVGRVGEATSAPQRAAMSQLLQRYLPALRAHLLIARRMSAEQAEEVLQDFVSSKILEQRLIDRSDRDRGKFRTFLLRALNNFAIDQHRRGRLERRMVLPTGRGEADADEAQRDPLNLADDDGAAAAPQRSVFDREWARGVMSRAIERMRQECEKTARADIWGVFDRRVLGPSMRDEPPASYAQLIAEFGFASPAQASNVLMTAKRSFARHLRAVVGEYAPRDAEILEELAELKQILVGAST